MLSLFDHHFTVTFPDLASHQIFCRLHPSGQLWLKVNGRLCVLLERSDLRAHSLALRCGAVISPGCRIKA